ncbi:MAG: FadR family transcriptional regulator [Gammaproteobacteria bacterium]|nr:MAG: FadR family transcriptional regulator [Gammaproteobacteria bacterium]
MDTAAIAPIKRQPVAEQVAQRLLGLIQIGNLKPGQQLPPERELAGMLEVSRPSLREALRALSLLGVLQIRQGGGVFVSSLDPELLLAPLHFFISLDSENLERLFDARIVIESAIARLAATRITPEAIATLKQCVNFEVHEIGNVDQFIESDVLFHQTIFAASDNPFLVRIATSLHILGRASREITGHIPGVLPQSLKDHRRIIAAMSARDPERAAAAMEAHLRNVRRAYHQRTPDGSRGMRAGA